MRFGMQLIRAPNLRCNTCDVGQKTDQFRALWAAPAVCGLDARALAPHKAPSVVRRWLGTRPWRRAVAVRHSRMPQQTRGHFKKLASPGPVAQQDRASDS